MYRTIRSQMKELGVWSWLGVPSRVFFGFLTCLFMYSIARLTSLEIHEFRDHVVAMCAFFVLSPVFGFDDLRRSYTRPITSLQLVVLPLFLSVMIVLASFLITASLSLWLLGTSVPIAGPAAVVVCATCCLHAAIWTPSTGTARGIGYALTIVALSVGILYIIPTYTLEELDSKSIAVYSGVLVLTAMAIAVTVLGVQRQRCGESIWSALTIPAYRSGRRATSESSFYRVTTTRFQNPWRAHFWYELRKIRNWLWLPVLIVPFVIVAFVAVCNHFDPSPKETFYVLVSGIVLCPILCQLLATIAVPLTGTVSTQGLEQHCRTTLISVYEATRPLRSDHLFSVKLLLVTGVSMISCFVMCISAMFYLRWFGDWKSVREVAESVAPPLVDLSVYWWIVGAFSGCILLFVFATLSVGSTNFFNFVFHPRIGTALGLMITTGVGLAIVDAATGWSFGRLWITFGYAIAAVIVLASVVAFKKSFGSRLLSRTYLVVTFSLWAAFVCTSAGLALRLSPAFTESPPGIAYAAGFAMLLAPLAATLVAPLEYAQRRHT